MLQRSDAYQNTCDNVGFVLELVVKSDSLVLRREESQAEVITPFRNFHHFAIGRHLHHVNGEVFAITLVVERDVPGQTDDICLKEVEHSIEFLAKPPQLSFCRAEKGPYSAAFGTQVNYLNNPLTPKEYPTHSFLSGIRMESHVSGCPDNV